MLLKGQTIFPTTRREGKGRREENIMGEGETQRWGGTTNPSNSLRDASMDGYEISKTSAILFGL